MWTAETECVLQSHHFQQQQQQLEQHQQQQQQQQEIRQHVRPEFRTPLTSKVASIGQRIELECELVAEPKANIFWKLNGKPLLISDRIKVSQRNIQFFFQRKTNKY